MFNFNNQNSNSNSNANTNLNSNFNFGGFNSGQTSGLNQSTSTQPNQMFSSFGTGSSSAAPFGTNPMNSNSGGLFGSLNNSISQPLASSQQTSTGITYPRDTNFMDLPADLRQSIEALEKTIQGHADASRPFSNRIDPTSQLDQIEGKLSLLEEKIAAYSCLHAQQNSKISSLKKATGGHWRYSENTARTIEASRNQPQNGKVTWSRAFAPNDQTASHYEEILREMDAQLNESEAMAEALKKQIEPFVSSSTSSLASPTESVKHLLKVEQEIGFALQRRYTQIRDEIEGMRRSFRNFCSKYLKDLRDPFAPKVIESAAKERERQLQPNDFFGISRPAATSSFSNNNNNNSNSYNNLNSMLPSATTGLPAKSSLGTFSFGR